MFRYTRAATPFHGLDPRVKLFLQGAFAVATIGITDLIGTGILVVLAGGALFMARIRVRAFLWQVRYILAMLALAPVAGAVQVGTPWLDPSGALGPAAAGCRVLALLAVGLVYVRSTSIRDSQAAVQWLIPGKPGRLLAIGVGLVFRFLPLLRDELQMTRTALRVRGATARPVHRRIQLLAIIGLKRTFDRTDRITHALLARCLSWNPTLPRLATTRADIPWLLGGIGLVAWALL